VPSSAVSEKVAVQEVQAVLVECLISRVSWAALGKAVLVECPISVD